MFSLHSRLRCDGLSNYETERLRNLCRTYLTHLHDHPDWTVHELFVMGRKKFVHYNDKYLFNQAVKENQRRTASALKKDSIAFLNNQRQDDLQRQSEECDGSLVSIGSLCAAFAATPLQETTLVVSSEVTEENMEEE